MGDVADGNDDDIFVDSGWKSEFEDTFSVDCIASGK